MTKLRLDKVQFFSGLDTYLNYDNITSDINISGTVANGNSISFSTEINYTRLNTRADLYATNLNTGIKMPLTGGVRIHPYQKVSTEIASIATSYSNNTITITLLVTNNTGSSINLISQTLRIGVVLVEAPTL